MSLKRLSLVNDVFPWLTDEDDNRLCAVCRKPCESKRVKYCSDGCKNIAYIRTSPSYARWAVARRDRGICALCGCDTRKLERIIRKANYREFYLDKVSIKKEMGFTKYHYWEMDHIIPVSKGGGLCGLDNLRTLCIPCHHAETRRLRSSRG